MIKIKVLLGAEQAKMFDRLYGSRGKFLHDELGRGTLAQAVNEAADIAVRLLDADLNSTGPRV